MRRIKRINKWTVIPAALAALSFALPARGVCDELAIESASRPAYSLNGTWKCRAGDSPSFSKTDFNDSSWKDVKIPGNLAKNGFAGAPVTWCRRNFTPPNGKHYGHLKIEGLLDSGQAWINGRSLINPSLPEPLDDTQYGVFGHIWRFDWKGFFRAAGFAIPGRENVIAVRIVNDSTRADGPFEQPAAKDRFGLTGDIYLVEQPELHIESLDRIPPKTSGGGKIRQQLFLLISNNGIKTRGLTASVNIYDETSPGKPVFSQTVDKDIPPGGEIYDFTWQTKPSFHTYRAVATLRGTGSSIVDQLAVRFHGAFVAVENGKLKVNGTPFVIRGVHGDFGLLTAGKNVDSNTYKQQWMEQDLKLARDSGANTIHTSHPTPELAAAALKLGMTLIPSLDKPNFGPTVIALLEYPNILFWEVKNNSRSDANSISGIISALDPYHRPVSFAGPQNAEPWKGVSANIALRAKSAIGSGAALCDQSSDDKSPLQYLYPWGISSSGAPPIPESQTLALLRQSWDSCVKSGKTQGAIYAELASNSPKTPGLRASSSLITNNLMSGVLSWAFRELAPDLYASESGGLALTLRSNSEYSLNSMRVFSISHGRKQLIATQSELDPGRNFNISAGSRGDNEFLAAYSSHNGLERSFSFDSSTPSLDPEEVRFDTSELYIPDGTSVKTAVYILNPRKTGAKASITLKSSDKSVSFDPEARNVFLKPGQSMLAPFNITGVKKTGSPATVTAVVEFKDGAAAPVKAILPVVVK